MLKTINCELFTKKTLIFHEGLNVILGDEKATNSIGKSTLLMVIDFVFGGSSFITFNKDVVEQMGHHFYEFSFVFEGKPLYFRRGTKEPTVLHECGADFKTIKTISLDEYVEFLRGKYLDEDQNLSFRAPVGLFTRIWGKDNREVSKPLHIVQAAKGMEGVDLLLKLFKRDRAYEEKAHQLKAKDKEFTAVKTALTNKVVPKINKMQYEENQKLIGNANKELDSIKDELAKFAMSITELSNKEVLELTQKKDSFLKVKLSSESDLRRINTSLSAANMKMSKSFSKLKEFFSDINEERILEIEGFHSGIKKILKKEIEERKAKLESDLQQINAEINNIDRNLETVLSKVKDPTFIVDRVTNLGKRISQATQENEVFEKKINLETSTKKLTKEIEDSKLTEIASIQSEINSEIKKIVEITYGENRKAPSLNMTMTSYDYKIINDTGTGKAFANLIIFDQAIFKLTNLPILAHDSLLFKNIENPAVGKLIESYEATTKQSFIALDDIEKYGPNAVTILKAKAVVELTEKSMLYRKDWRR